MYLYTAQCPRVAVRPKHCAFIAVLDMRFEAMPAQAQQQHEAQQQWFVLRIGVPCVWGPNMFRLFWFVQACIIIMSGRGVGAAHT